MYQLKYTDEAIKNLKKLKKQGNYIKLKKIRDCLEKIRQNPRHPGLHTHKNESFKTYDEEDTFQSYVENRVAGAYRVFWHYGAGMEVITILAITPHP